MVKLENCRGVKQKTDIVKALDDALNGCVKFVSKDYICYRRDYIYENLEREFAMLKQCRDMKAISQEEVEEILNECKRIKNEK